MIKALIRTVLLVVVIVVAAQFVPALAPYETLLVVLALVTGLFGIIARSMVLLLLIAAALAAYFFLLH